MLLLMLTVKVDDDDTASSISVAESISFKAVPEDCSNSREDEDFLLSN